ncbi:ketopantoate reductase family protein [Halovenus rubra]|uniref:Ketopantoate reductase family protein n=2 Tax=Halovenus rubra TaxID=869890 RepID=A0ACC7DZ09_9EURY|nr:ketopantoate reductase family protein [Halovenus rubra]
MEICVFGAGSLGSLVGGLLADNHQVTLVGRQPHVDAIEADGLAITGAVDRSATLNAVTTVPATAELAIVTVKSFDTEAAAQALQAVELDGVLSLQNGMGNEEQLAAELAAPVLAGTATYGAHRTEPGTVECTGLGEVVLGPTDGGKSTLADSVGKAFTESGIETTVSAEMPRYLWEKLAVNAGINAATALARVPNGAVVETPGEDVARHAAREAVQTGRKQGVSLEPADAAQTTVSVAASTARNRSSMLQDIESGSRTEIDAINGYVVEQANRPVPVNETLTGLIKTWEKENDLRL